MPRPRRPTNREYAMGRLAYELRDVKPIAPDEIPDERATFIMWALVDFAKDLARTITRKAQ